MALLVYPFSQIKLHLHHPNTTKILLHHKSTFQSCTPSTPIQKRGFHVSCWGIDFTTTFYSLFYLVLTFLFFAYWSKWLCLVFRWCFTSLLFYNPDCFCANQIQSFWWSNTFFVCSVFLVNFPCLCYFCLWHLHFNDDPTVCLLSQCYYRHKASETSQLWLDQDETEAATTQTDSNSFHNI